MAYKGDFEKNHTQYHLNMLKMGLVYLFIAGILYGIAWFLRWAGIADLLPAGF